MSLPSNSLLFFLLTIRAVLCRLLLEVYFSRFLPYTHLTGFFPAFPDFHTFAHALMSAWNIFFFYIFIPLHLSSSVGPAFSIHIAFTSATRMSVHFLVSVSVSLGCPMHVMLHLIPTLTFEASTIIIPIILKYR